MTIDLLMCFGIFKVANCAILWCLVLRMRTVGGVMKLVLKCL